MSERSRAVLGVLAALVGAAYLVWRAGWSLNTSALWLALPLFFAELHGYFTYLGYLLMTWRMRPPAELPAPAGMTVDFFIPTYNEPVEVLEPTVAGAKAVRYPHETYVLDDGRRPWVRRMCHRLGVHYIKRDNNRGAKAGNINHALARTRGEFVAVVDADFVPAADFIDVMLGQFQDEKVAFVQGPQEFYNTDSFQHSESDTEAWHEQAMFFRTIQVGKNNWNAAFWCGSPSLLRRAAIESVGGVAEETVTEDLHTSIRLHKAGWKSVYYPRPVARGLAPDDFHGFILQRLRWAQGAMQVIRREWPGRGLSLAQRLNYLASTSTYFDSYRKAVFLAIVPAMLLTDQIPVRANVWIFAPLWLAQFVTGSLATSALGRGVYRYFLIEFYDLTKTFAFLRSSLTLISNKPVRFRVTPKTAGARSLNPFLAPFLVMGLVYVDSLAIGVFRLAGLGLGAANPLATAVAMAWGVAVLVFLAVISVYGYYHVNKRQAYRLGVDLSARIETSSHQLPASVRIRDLAMTGCGLESAVPLISGQAVWIEIDSLPTRVRGTVRTVFESDGLYRAGVAFRNTGTGADELAALVARLVNHDFVDDGLSHKRGEKTLALAA